MPVYIYKAKHGPSKTVEGEVIAENETSALGKVEGMGLAPVWVREKGLGRDPDGAVRGRISRRDVDVFTRQLAGLFKSGVPILRALRTVREECAGRAFGRVVMDIEDQVRDGKMLSEALARHAGVFPDLYVSMVRSGEAGGIVDVVLLRLADAREKEEELRKKVQAALAYPMLVLAVGALTVLAMLFLFLPKITALFRHFKDIPLPTRILMRISDFCREKWYWLAAPFVVFLALLRRATSGKKGREVADSIKLGLPLFGRLVLEAGIARFARMMSLLLDAGIPVEKALLLSSETLNNTVLRSEIAAVREKTLTHGMSVAAGLRESRHFPVFVRNMIAVGEEGGRLDEALRDVAAFYEREVERRMSIITSLIEPVLILVVGGVVGFIVFAMLLPIFAVTRSLAR